MTEMIVLLDDEEHNEVLRMAQAAHLTEQQLVQQLIDSQLRPAHGSAVPRYARRLGPLVLPAS